MPTPVMTISDLKTENINANTKREQIPSPFPTWLEQNATETRRTRLIFVTSLNGKS